MALAGVPVALTDQSHARAAIRVQGPDWRALLSKGCDLDFHPRAFIAGRCASTRMAHTSVTLHALPDDHTVDLYVPRSYARHFFEWLCDAAGEFGYRVD